MDVLILGGVAAGTKVAAKLKREDRSYNVTILTNSSDISYAGCGLPYYVGGLIEKEEDLIVNTPESFEKLTGAKVVINVEAKLVDKDNKKVKATNLSTGEEVEYSYDKLVIATGADPVKPPIEGIDLEGVYFMRTPEDAISLRAEIDKISPKRAVVVGGGFIGLEVAENLTEKGIITTVIDMAETVPPGFDKDMTNYITDYLADQRVMVFTGTKLETINGEDGRVSSVKTDRNKMKADVLIMSLGIRANTRFLSNLDLDLMPNGTIKVNEYLETNIEDIYAVGDCATVMNRVTKEPAWSPMGSTANIAGRILAQNLKNQKIKYNGAIGTAVAKLLKLNIGRTGLTEAAAKDAGFNPVSIVTVVDDKAHYYPGSSLFIMKMTADRDSKQLLGLQVLGLDGAQADKMVDTAVVGISLGANLEELKDLDLAYAPPFSTAISPFAHTVNVLINKIDGRFVTMTPLELLENGTEGYKIMDVALNPEIAEATYVDLAGINGEVEGFAKDDKILISCSKGKRAYMAQNRLRFYGYTNTTALEGGSIVNKNIK